MKSNKGFSLVELIVVIAIMAIIAGVAIPVYTTYINNAEEKVLETAHAEVEYAIGLECTLQTVNKPEVTVDKTTKVITVTFKSPVTEAQAKAVIDASATVIADYFESGKTLTADTNKLVYTGTLAD